jgi:hypothetical protein
MQQEFAQVGVRPAERSKRWPSWRIRRELIRRPQMAEPNALVRETQEEIETHCELNESNLLLRHFARELLKQRLLLRVEFVQMMELSGREYRANSFAKITVWGMAPGRVPVRATPFIDRFKLFFSRVFSLADLPVGFDSTDFPHRSAK